MSDMRKGDVFEEFSFKPLTDGLGFHNKVVNLKNEVKNSKVAEPPILPSGSPDGLIKKPQFVDPRIQDFKDQLKIRTSSSQTSPPFVTSPLPRAEVENQQKTPPQKAASTSVQIESIFPSLRDSLDFKSEEQTSHYDVKKGAAEGVQWSLSAALLDGLVILALSLVFLMSLLTIVKVDLIEVVGASAEAQNALMFLYLSILVGYLVIARTFFGSTLGEWAFDMKMGKQSDFENPYYALKVLNRTLIVVITGLVLVPILTVITGKDWAGWISGLKLYRLE